MPRPVGWACKTCQHTWKARASKSGKKQCPACKSDDTERVIPPSVAQVDDEAETPIPTAPTGVPQSPVSTKMVAMSPAITAESLLAAKSKLKPPPVKIVPPTKLPGFAAGKSLINDAIRIIATKVQHGYVGDVVLKRKGPSWDKSNRFYCLKYPARNVAFAFQCIASGQVNAAHGRFNSRYHNSGVELPTRSTPLNGPRGSVAYFEYGWRTVPPHRNWRLENGDLAPINITKALNQFLDQDGNLDVERVIIDQTGEVFYTPDHYQKFYRYHFGLGTWFNYFCTENFVGTPDWDRSAYQLK